MKYQNVKTGAVFESDSICVGEDWKEVQPSPAPAEVESPKEPEKKPQPRTKAKRTKK